MAPKTTAVRRLSAAIMITAILLPAGFGPVQAAPPVEREWIVSLGPGGDIAARAKALTKEVGRSPKHIYTNAIRGFSFRGPERAAARIAAKPGVRQVVRSEPVSLIAESTPSGIRRIDARHPTAADAHDSGFRGAGVSIAILDTGVDLDHPDLAANIDAARGKNCMGAGPPEDGHGHGSHVAGTAAGVADNGIGIVGVAPSARIVPIKVLD
ncbi:MAG TPA: S8 family serine peptidase, partial [Candidatus Limnocylindrales bacterium]|nr:S8 family serine peptidase [Candidatus Limnocylindrales bacterium]